MTHITQATIIGKSQNRTALGMMKAYLTMYPSTTLTELNTHFSKQKVCPDTGIDKLFYTADEIEQEKQGSRAGRVKWFRSGNACFVADGEWLSLANGQQVAFNKVWTGKSLALLQQELAKSHIYGEVGSVPKGNAVGFVINYDYDEEEYEPQGLPSWIWLVLALIIIVGGYFAYTTFFS